MTVLDVLNRMTELLAGLLGSPWLWAIVFVVAALDAILPFMPSETTVIIVGVLVVPDAMLLGLLIVLATAGGLAGDWVGYTIGRRSGPAMLARLGQDEKGRQRYEWTQAMIWRHGTLLLTAGRYIPGVRAATMYTAGALGYPVRRFLITDIVGVSVWASYAALAGYLGGATFHDRPALGMLMAFGMGLALAVSIEVGRRLVARRRTGLLSSGHGDARDRGVSRGGRGTALRPGGRTAHALHFPGEQPGAHLGAPRRRAAVRAHQSPSAADCPG